MKLYEYLSFENCPVPPGEADRHTKRPAYGANSCVLQLFRDSA